MKRLLLPLILFFLTVFEGVALELLPASIAMGKSLIVPHWVFVFLLLIAIFYDREDTYYSVFYGVIFGLLIDVVYTGVLGVYMFSYAVVVYLIHELKKLVLTNFYVTALLGIVGLASVDASLNIIYSAVGIADMLWEDYLFYRLLPTVIANLTFLIILYPFVRKKLLKWKKEQLFSGSAF